MRQSLGVKIKNEGLMQAYWKTSELEGDNTHYLEMLYDQYLLDPTSIDSSWLPYFSSLKVEGNTPSHQAIREELIALAAHPQFSSPLASSGTSAEEAFRQKGHFAAQTDPLNLQKKPTLSDLGLDANLDQFKALYCGSVGYQMMHIEDEGRRRWLCEQIENPSVLSPETKKYLLQRLVAADGLEKYLGTQFPGQKRFSLEGGDAFIPLLDTLIQSAEKVGVQEIVLGMAHRGRLNTLINVMGKAPAALFKEFEGFHEHDLIAGDVKYHNGFSSDLEVSGRPLHIALAFNPSHLEIVSAVVEGSVRARQVRRDNQFSSVLAIQVHGDAAFSGQGCVYELLNMAQTKGFGNGGSIHIVINNQVGFTTNPVNSRSTPYCTDIAKMFDAPIFHVNGHDPEAVFRVAELAVKYRHLYQKDVFIDLVCYRRHGHNEADEPSGTQPLMYQVIKNLPVPAKLYADTLIQEKVILEADYQAMQLAYKQSLDAGLPLVSLLEKEKNRDPGNNWLPFKKKTWRASYSAPLTRAKLQNLMKALTTIPDDFALQAQVAKAVQDRVKMAAEEVPFNWGGAELLAYATLLANEIPVRLSGEDSGRGTFSHRHCVLHDQKIDAHFISLNHLQAKQAPFTVIDTVLSEEGVLGFEYGYAGSCPNGLTIWEAQFGDFVNGAQVIIDQFISSAEEKWGRLNGLVLLLPHGQEGMGPEHSSARLERFLQLCAHDNMQVCAPTTPAQIYHLLRRQVLRAYRAPLVIMSPKSLLRHPLAVSSLDDLEKGQFFPVLPELDAPSPRKIKRVVLCQGKVYYDLLAKRRDLKKEDVALIRIEQMYPFPDAELREVLKPYAHVKEWAWCQEEPFNQGAWFKLRDDFAALDLSCAYLGRSAFASPAVGYANVFKEEQADLVLRALTGRLSV